jgi:chemotaxis protein CheC
MMDYAKLSNLQLDAIKEVGNIGAAHAATALSQIINRTIMINVSHFEIVAFNDISRTVGGKDAQAVVVELRVFGDMTGGILLALTRKNALCFADVLKGNNPGTIVILDETDESALKEAGSILAAAYLKAMGSFLKFSLIHSVPRLFCDKMGKILEQVFQELSRRAEITFCIETEFVESTRKISGHFLLIPDVKSLEIMLKALKL